MGDLQAVCLFLSGVVIGLLANRRITPEIVLLAGIAFGGIRLAAAAAGDGRGEEEGPQRRRWRGWRL